MTIIKKSLLITAGFTSLSMGLIGIFVPVLPTTPFLILSAACFLKSSDMLYKWLIHNKIFGKYINNYLKFKAISLKSKIVSIVLLWSVILCSIFFYINFFWIKILLLFIALSVTIHILKIRTLTKEMIESI